MTKRAEHKDMVRRAFSGPAAAVHECMKRLVLGLGGVLWSLTAKARRRLTAGDKLEPRMSDGTGRTGFRSPPPCCPWWGLLWYVSSPTPPWRGAWCVGRLGRQRVLTTVVRVIFYACTFAWGSVSVPPPVGPPGPQMLSVSEPRWTAGVGRGGLTMSLCSALLVVFS